MAASVEGNVQADPKSFVDADGRLNLKRILTEFAAFWKEHGELLAGGMTYHEVAPQLVLMAYLQRVVNGGGIIDREYGVGRGRIDLCIRWPHKGESGERVWQKEAIEIKVWAKGKGIPGKRAGAARRLHGADGGYARSAGDLRSAAGGGRGGGADRVLKRCGRRRRGMR